MATIVNSTVSPEGMAEIMRQIRQYRATHGVDMPQTMLNALIQGQAKANSAEATKRAALAQDQSQFQRAMSLKEDMAKKEQDYRGRALDAAMLTGGAGLAYKLGKEAWKNPDISGKVKDIFGFGGTKPMTAPNPAPKGYDTNGVDLLKEQGADSLGSSGVSASQAPAPDISASAPEVTSTYQNPTSVASTGMPGVSIKGRPGQAPSPSEAPVPQGSFEIPQVDAGLGTAGQNTDYTGAQKTFGGNEFRTLSANESDMANAGATLATAGDGIAQMEGQGYMGQVVDAIPDTGSMGSEITKAVSPTEAPTPNWSIPENYEDIQSVVQGDYGGSSGMSLGGAEGGLLSGGLNAIGQLATSGEINAGSLGDAVLGGAAGELAGSWAGAEIGATMGSVGGPAGMVVGAVVGTVVSSIASAIGGGRVICTELNRQGLLDPNVYALDQEYTRQNLDDDVIRGYLVWAQPLANKMKTSPLLTKLVLPFARSWSYTMASRLRPLEYKPRTLGRFLLWAGVPACRLLGSFLRKRKEASAWAA